MFGTGNENGGLIRLVVKQSTRKLSQTSHAIFTRGRTRVASSINLRRVRADAHALDGLARGAGRARGGAGLADQSAQGRLRRALLLHHALGLGVAGRGSRARRAGALRGAVVAGHARDLDGLLAR